MTRYWKSFLKKLLIFRTLVVAEVIIAYLRFVWHTRIECVIGPSEYYKTDAEYAPYIIATWHGQNYLLPFARPRAAMKIRVLASRHRDGGFMVRVLKRLGLEVIRGSGAGLVKRDFARKGGTAALANMIDSLSEGYIVALTADVPKVSRKTGRGILKLACESGRPIVPVASVTSRRKIWKGSWDKTTIPFPFSRIVLLIGDPIFIKKLMIFARLLPKNQSFRRL